MNQLNNKRKRVFLVILASMIGNAVITAAPKLNVESAHYVFLTFTNVAMFIIVWDFYFEEQLLHKSIRLFLKDLLVITCISFITTFVVFKGLTKATNHFTAAYGSFGWLIAGAIAALVTAIMGIFWAFYCEDLYRNSD